MILKKMNENSPCTEEFLKVLDARMNKSLNKATLETNLISFEDINKVSKAIHRNYEYHVENGDIKPPINNAIYHMNESCIPFYDVTNK